ncbi:MAG: ABC transporter permease [Vicinamibacterales bacterium]
MARRLLRRLSSFLRTFVRGLQLDRELDDELRAYLDHEIARRVAAGSSAAEARRLVLAEEGGIEPIKERTRAVRFGFGLATVLQDLRYGARSMARSPGFALVACLTLALGIGANVAMFTVMRSVLWRPLPYADGERLVILDSTWRGLPHAGLSPREISDLRRDSRTLSHLAVVNGVGAHVEIDGEVEFVPAASVSADLLPSLGARPAHGRLFDARDDSLHPDGQVRSVIFSDALWRQRLGADPGAIGRWITVNNTPRQLIGVLPADFQVFLPASTSVQEATHVWFPTSINPAENFRGNGAIGRLRAGVTLDDARRELEVFAARFASDRPEIYRDAAATFRVDALRQALAADIDAGLWMLGAAVAFVLLVSCVNIANLTLARSSGRARELAVRRALGATRVRIVRQLLTESLLLAAIGGAGGLVIGRLGLQLLDWLRTTDLPRQSQVGLDGQVTLFSIGITLAAGVICGVLPAFRFAAGDAQALKAGRADSPARGQRRLQRGLVIAEIALSIVPLVAAGLMVRSFVNLTQAPLGFRPDGIVTAWMPLSFRQFSDVDARVRVHAAVLDRIRELPGVHDVSAASPPPFHDFQVQMLERYGRAGDTGPGSHATRQSALPGYLRVVGTRLVAGREFTDDDLRHKRQVVIIDERIARELWPSGAIGQQMWVGAGRRASPLEVIGVTEPVRVANIGDDSTPHLFVPYHKFTIDMVLAIRTDTPAEALAPVLKRIAAEAGTSRAVMDVWPLRDYVDKSMADTRFMMLVLTAFAGLSMLLAAIGLYGTLSYLTSQRSREFGVRLALGASSRQILRLVAGEGVVLTAIGAAAGLAGAIAAARALRGLLYGVEPLDPATLAAVTAAVAVLAVLASLKPAWSASRVDPTRALRAD